MTARTRSTLGPSDGRRRGTDPDGRPNKPAKPSDPQQTPNATRRLGWSAAPARLRIALLASVAGAALTCVGLRQGLVENPPAPAFASSALLLVLAVVPAALALGSLLVGRAPAAAGIMTGTALLAPGLALVDAQFLLDPLQVARPEFIVPTSLATLNPATGATFLLAGHVVTALAGVLAAGRAGARPDTDYFAALDASIDGDGRGRIMGWALAAGAVSVVGLLMPPFRSDNAFVVAHDLIGSPALVRYGGMLIALAVLFGCIAAAVNLRPPLARGLVIGMVAALAWLVVPQLFAVGSVDWLHLDRISPLLAIVPVGLLALALFGARTEADEDDREVQLETSPLHIATGVLGVLSGAAAFVGSFGALVVVEFGGEQPESYANRPLLPAGIVIMLLSVALFTRWASAVRPAFVVALGAIGVVGAAALDAAFTGTSAGNLTVGMPVVAIELRVGAAGWFAITSVVLAAAAAVTAGIAGWTERDDVDLSRRVFHLRYAVLAAGGVLFAIGAFGSPMIKATEFTAPGIWTEFRLASWGLVIGLLVVVAAAVIAALARPARAAALLFGAAVVVGVHLLEYPMTGDRVEGAQAGAGTWLSLACFVALLVAAVAAATDPDRE